MRVRTLMTSPALVVGPEAPAWEALGLMRRHRIRRLPVVDGEVLVGIITWTDVVRVHAPAVEGPRRTPTLSVGVLVRHLMASAPVTVDPDATIEQAAALMRRHKIGGLPVVEDGRLVGVITESDLFEAFAEMLGAGPHEVKLHLAVGSISVELPRIVSRLTKAGIPIVAVHTLRTSGAEVVELVVHENDVGRAREVLHRLALETDVVEAQERGDRA
ncbi:MAG: CBS domain-containing protein [Armatimonadetes bacterium]|nr:CBS domain-containing protein [Armatimonadota bacterium]